MGRKYYHDGISPGKSLLVTILVCGIVLFTVVGLNYLFKSEVSDNVSTFKDIVIVYRDKQWDAGLKHNKYILVGHNQLVTDIKFTVTEDVYNKINTNDKVDIVYDVDNKKALSVEKRKD